MRIGIAIVLAMTLGAVASCHEGGGAGGGGCEAASLVVDQSVVAPGSSVEIRGTGFFDGCADGAGNGQEIETMVPLEGAELLVRQDDVLIAETPVDVDADGTFTTTLEIPADVGDAPLTVEVPAMAGTEPLTLTVERD